MRVAALAESLPELPQDVREEFARMWHDEEQHRRIFDLLARAPENAEAYFILGLLAEAAGKADAAERQLKRCLYLQPDHYEALCHLALLTEQGGNRSAAATLKARAARVYQRQQVSG